MNSGIGWTQFSSALGFFDCFFIMSELTQRKRVKPSCRCRCAIRFHSLHCFSRSELDLAGCSQSFRHVKMLLFRRNNPVPSETVHRPNKHKDAKEYPQTYVALGHCFPSRCGKERQRRECRQCIERFCERIIRYFQSYENQGERVDGGKTN